MARPLHPEVIEHIKCWEGFRANAYPDPGSVNGKPVTIGYGQNRRSGKPVQLGETITKPLRSNQHDFRNSKHGDPLSGTRWHLGED